MKFWVAAACLFTGMANMASAQFDDLRWAVDQFDAEEDFKDDPCAAPHDPCGLNQPVASPLDDWGQVGSTSKINLQTNFNRRIFVGP